MSKRFIMLTLFFLLISFGYAQLWGMNVTYDTIDFNEQFNNFNQWTNSNWVIVNNRAYTINPAASMGTTNFTFDHDFITIEFQFNTTGKKYNLYLKEGATYRFNIRLTHDLGNNFKGFVYSYADVNYVPAGASSVDLGVLSDLDIHNMTWYRNRTSEDWCMFIDNRWTLRYCGATADGATYNTILDTTGDAVYVDKFYDNILLYNITDYIPAPPAGTNDTINLSSLTYPLEGSQFNYLPISFNGSGNFSFNANCTLYINNTANKTTPITAGLNVDFNISVDSFNSGTYGYFFSCYDNMTMENTTSKYFYVDLVNPLYYTDFLNNTMTYKLNITGQFNFSDDIILRSVNLSIDGNTFFNKSNINSSTYQYNMSYDIQNLSIGRHTLGVYYADGHTANKLKESAAYVFKNGLFGAYAEWQIDGEYKSKTIRTRNKEWGLGALGDVWTHEIKEDRVQEIYRPGKPKKKQTFVIESSKEIEIITHPSLYGGSWLIINNEHWKDFVLEGEPNATIDIKKIDPYTVEVTIDNIQRTDRLVFQSLGDLNIVQKNISFYHVNVTEEYSPLTLDGYIWVINASVDFGNLYDLNITTFLINYINDSTNADGYNSNLGNIIIDNQSTYKISNRIANYTVDPYENPIIPQFIPRIDHYWSFLFFDMNTGDILGVTRSWENTTRVNLTRSNVIVSPCNVNYTFRILNMSYYDDVTKEAINLTNAYNLRVYDGTYYYNQTGSFTGNYSNAFCTNIAPANLTYNWEAWGSFTLSKPSYVTRILDYDEAFPLILSNSPQTFLNQFLIKLSNSTTVKYNWYSTDFQPIDGTMLIYQCLENGTRNLIESTPIISGVGYANIQLLIQPYSYEIISEGILYQNENSFTKCHTEAESEVTNYVEISSTNIDEYIGLGSIRCTLYKVNNETVRMVWGSNPELGGYVSGCIQAFRRGVYGNIEVYNNCSGPSSGYNRTVTIPMNGNEYIIRGYLQQNGMVVNCDNQISFGVLKGQLFGSSGVIATILLIIAIVLMFAGENVLQLFGAGVGLIAAWLLGILNFPWILISTLLLFLIIIGLIGRHCRKR